MTRWLQGFLVLGWMAFFTASCGGGNSNGGGSSGPDTSSLAGTWFGVYEYAGSSNTLGSISVVVSSHGTFTYTITGTPNAGSGSGTLSSAANGIWSTDIGGTSGGFIVDSSFTPAHAAFAEYGRNYAVLQKGGTALPSVLPADIAHPWNGSGVYLSGPYMDITQTFGLQLTIANSGTLPFSGSQTPGGSFLGSLPSQGFMSTYGLVMGTVTQSAITSNIHVLITQDKGFAGYWACPQGTFIYPDDCGFGALR